MQVKLQRNFNTGVARYRKGVVDMPDDLAGKLPKDAVVLVGPVRAVGPVRDVDPVEVDPVEVDPVEVENVPAAPRRGRPPKSE